MSSQANAAIIAEYEGAFVNNCCVITASVFLIYEYFITLDREVNAFWGGRRTGAWLLFLSNRYIPLFTNALGLVEFGAFFTDQSCATYVKIIGALVVQYIPWAAFSGLRSFALSRSRGLGIFVFLLSLMPVPINFARYGFQYGGFNDPSFGCYAVSDVTTALQIKFIIVSRGCLIAADIILIVVTFASVPRSVGWSSGYSLGRVLLRDGAIYFLVLLVMNTLHLVFSLSSIFGFASNAASNLTAYTQSVTAVLVSRFLLDLQEASRHECRLDSSDDPGMMMSSTSGAVETIGFARIVGSIGSTLESFSFGVSASGDEEEWSNGSDSDTVTPAGQASLVRSKGSDLKGFGGGQDLEPPVELKTMGLGTAESGSATRG